MTVEQLLSIIETAGYICGNVFQVTYVVGSESRTDAWNAHCYKDGKWVKGAGKTLALALANVIEQMEPVGNSLEDML